MSYDLDLCIDGSNDHSYNITYNVSPMFYHHNREGIKGLNGLSGSEGALFLQGMINHFMNYSEELEAMNPANGWGSYDNTLQCLIKMFTASKNNPNAQWYVYN